MHCIDRGHYKGDLIATAHVLLHAFPSLHEQDPMPTRAGRALSPCAGLAAAQPPKSVQYLFADENTAMRDRVSLNGGRKMLVYMQLQLHLEVAFYSDSAQQSHLRPTYQYITRCVSILQ